MYSAYVPEWNLDILSAESFPNAPYPQSIAPPFAVDPQPLALNPFVETNQPLHNAVSRDKVPAARVKRKPKHKPKTQPQLDANDAELDGNSKKRGRPRVHTGNETATERRRTQIRLAQRAYRSRKEAVITKLNERVARLESTIEEMNKTFLSFNDEALSSGLLATQPELTERLRHATKRFLELASDASRYSDDEQDEESPPQGSSADANKPPGEALIAEPKDTGVSSLSYQMPADYSYPYAQNTSMPIALESMAENSTSLNYRSQPNDGPQFLYSGRSSIPRDPSPHRQYTYSFQELSFSRRFQRRCLERGYSLLVNPHANQNRVNDVFRFSFGILTKERLAKGFASLLQRKAGEPLEFWNKPFFCIGRAGMHYPHEDEFGNIIFPPNMHPAERALGPMPFHNAETPHGLTSVDDLIDSIGYGGDWFDCHDVEGYLLEKGIKLSSRSTFVPMPASAIAGQASSGTSHLASPSGSHGTDGSMASNVIPTPGSSPGYVMNTTSTETHYPYQNEVCSQMIELLGLEPDPSLRLGGAPKPAPNLSPNNQDLFYNTPSLILDVDKFVGELCSRIVCLGRAPGIRRQDVDSALEASVSNQR